MIRLFAIIMVMVALVLGCSGEQAVGLSGENNISGFSRASGEAHCYSPLIISASAPMSIDGGGISNYYIDRAAVPRYGLYFIAIYTEADIVGVNIRLNGSFEGDYQFSGQPITVTEGPYQFILYDAGYRVIMD